MANRKRIKVLHVYTDTGIVDPPAKLQKNFASYAAVMRKLEIGQSVLVQVESGSGDFWIREGYGDVTRNSATGYTVPRFLLMEY